MVFFLYLKEVEMIYQIEAFFKDFCEKEYVYYLEDGAVVRLIVSINQLPHLIGIHKYVEFIIVRQFNDKQNTDVNASNIFDKLRETGINYNSIKLCSSYNEHKWRIEKLTYDNLKDLLYNTRIFDFINSPKNGVGKRILLRINGGFHLQLILGEENNNHFLNSFYVGRKKDKCISEKGIYVNRLVITDIANSARLIIYEKNYEEIRKRKNKIENNIAIYYKMNDEFHQTCKGNNRDLLEKINTHSKLMKSLYKEFKQYLKTEENYMLEATKKMVRFENMLNARLIK